MPRRKFIDKKSATTFHLVHRAQNDPLIHDDNASSMVFKEIGATNASKIRSRNDLESEFGDRLRDNEGEAASYGVYFDDTEYDYMQHIRDLGNEGAVFVTAGDERKKNGKQKLEDALRDISFDGTASESGISLSSTTSSLAEEYFDQSMLPSDFVQKITYQNQQDVPDSIAGFQPDMDPRLREVLQALDDEAYVDEEEDDVFAELTAGGMAEEMDEQSWEDRDWWPEADEDGWESDVTVKIAQNATPAADKSDQSLFSSSEASIETEEGQNEDWMAEYNKYKKDLKAGKAIPATPVDAASSLFTGASGLTQKGKKRKGALTNPSSYSMSSSAIFRTDHQTLLDARFDKIEETYAEEGFPDDASDFHENASVASEVSKMSGLSRVSAWSAAPSEAPKLTSQFNGIMDDFLNNHNRGVKNKQRVRRGKPQTGLEQLDEIRSELGPARVKT